MNPELKQLLDSIGAISEAAHFFYVNLRKNGFNKRQSFKLTQTFVSGLLPNGGK
ncbi:MAG TPA: hypothetical protein VHO94_04155 [Oscillospiraceae bacterium]|nr:hypothetical protein [Oscillospiraceae bacterium]